MRKGACCLDTCCQDCLHIEFEYDKSKYHLKDVIVGKVYFLLVRIKIKHMELNIIRRETAGTGSNTANQQNDNETLSKFEIMDGAPVKEFASLLCRVRHFYNAESQISSPSNLSAWLSPVMCRRQPCEKTTIVLHGDLVPCNSDDDRTNGIPVRLYLTGFELTPTYKNVQNKFSARYFLNLVLVDEEDRRYFKQQEIFLWRKKIG